MTSALILAAEENSNPLIPALGEVVIGTIAFAVLCFVLMKYAFPRAEALYAERRDKIEGGLERAEKTQAQAKATLEQYRAQLAEARSEANAIRERAHEDARRIREEMRREAEAEREERLARFEEQLRAERAQAAGSLRREVGGIAMQLSERIVGHDLERSETQRQLVDDFIAGLEAPQAQGQAQGQAASNGDAVGAVGAVGATRAGS